MKKPRVYKYYRINVRIYEEDRPALAWATERNRKLGKSGSYAQVFRDMFVGFRAEMEKLEPVVK